MQIPARFPKSVTGNVRRREGKWFTLEHMTRFLAKPGGEMKSQLSVCKTIILIAQCSRSGQEYNLEVSGYHEKTQGPLTSDLTFSASAGQAGWFRRLLLQSSMSSSTRWVPARHNNLMSYEKQMRKWNKNAQYWHVPCSPPAWEPEARESLVPGQAEFYNEF